MDSTLQRLKNGIIAFQHKTYPVLAETYKRAAREPQRPHTLMMTCADSRIDIESVTHASPGELFIMRNVGNIVPAYGELLGGVSAVVEYAVSVLKVNHIVVCGHSDCGAMKALRAPESTEGLPTVKSWLKNAHAAQKVADSLAPEGESPEQALARLTECNVFLQLQHLKTHPSVAGALARNEITVSGWVYDIGSGRVQIAEDGKREFLAVEAQEES
jgi:carbonic anhydrase